MKAPILAERLHPSRAEAPTRCPACGGAVDRIHARHGGAIADLVWSGVNARVERLVRPATFDACGACEWAAEPGR